MDTESLEEELYIQSLKKRVKNITWWLRVNNITLARSQHRLHPNPHLVSPQDHNPTMQSSSLQPLRADVAPGRHELLPPISPAPSKKQQQQQPCSSSSSMPAHTQGQDLVLLNQLEGDRLPKRGDPHSRKNLTGLDFALPLKPVIHRRAPRNTLKALPSPAIINSERQNKLEDIKTKSSVKPIQDACLKSKSKNDRYGNQDIGCQVQVEQLVQSTTIPTMPPVPAPPQTAKPQVANVKQFSRLPRRIKAASLKHKSEEAVEIGKKEDVREYLVEEKPVRVARQTSKLQPTRDLPELAKLSPEASPEWAIQQALRLLREDDWEQKVKALTSIRSLSQHHAEVLLPRLHNVCLAVTHEVKNLRSVVSCAAMETLAHLYAHLGRAMDAEAEATVKTLLPKAGEASSFIRRDVQLALDCMVHNITPFRSMNALINTGLRHRNAAVRKAAAQNLESLAEVMGAARVLSGKKDLTDRFVHSISCLALDPAQEVRTHARNTLAFLASHPQLINMVDRFAPQGDRIAVKDVINKCQRRK